MLVHVGPTPMNMRRDPMMAIGAMIKNTSETKMGFDEEARITFGEVNVIPGAGHDSVYVARVAPTSMFFVPCENGISPQ